MATTTECTTDILICGSGAAGLTLAIDLARRKVSFRLIEKAEKPFHGSRGKGIQPRTQEVFEDLGVIKQLKESGGQYPIMREYRENGFNDVITVEHRNPTPAEPYAMPIMVPQFLTEAVLRNKLTELGHYPEFGCELIGFEQNSESVTARLVSKKGKETIRVRYLIGADGGKSFVRHAINIDFPGETLKVRAVVADLTLEGLSRDVLHCWRQTPTTPLALCPLAGTELFQLQMFVPMDGEPDLSAVGLTAIIAKRTGRNDIIVRSVSWSSVYSMNARLANNYCKGRVFLVGDSAHIHPPTGGQGLNTSVQDAYNLGWKLAAVLRGAPASLLDSYEAERRPIAAEMLGLSTKLLGAAEKGNMQRGRDTQQLDLGYRESVLSIPSSIQNDSIRAGDRAPDAPCRTADGKPIHLFDLLQGVHWTLLGYETDRTTFTKANQNLRIYEVGEKGDIVDEAKHIRDAYKLSPNKWVLIRPDGYIAAIVPTKDTNDLIAYMRNVGINQEDQLLSSKLSSVKLKSSL